MTAKQTTFDILSHLQKGEKFTGHGLADEIQERTGELHYPGTCLRYVREYRRTRGVDIVNINKAKSLYEVMG